MKHELTKRENEIILESLKLFSFHSSYANSSNNHKSEVNNIIEKFENNLKNWNGKKHEPTYAK